jgi:alpha-tubulin suppressor-like RCC1 family protein
MGEVYAWSNGGAPTLVERFTGVPLTDMRGTTADCVLLSTAAGDLLFHGSGTKDVETLCSQVSGTVVSADVGKSHFVAVTDAGIGFTQGESELGQTGQGHTDDLETPFPLKVKMQLREVRAGANHSVALSVGGQVFTWGTGFFGQHGGATRRPQMVPRQLSFQKARISAIAVGDDFSLAVSTDGRLWSWGANDCGQLGHGDSKMRLKPQVRCSSKDKRTNSQTKQKLPHNHRHA